MPPQLNLDPATLDLTRIIADRDAIRKINPQRFEMEMLDAVVFDDIASHTVCGYKDIRQDEFWIKGHMPGFPLMPGVMLCEAAAQISAYHTMKNKLLDCDFVGFGGMDEVRFRASVYPGQRLVLVGKVIKLHRKQVIAHVQGFVEATMVFHGNIIGIPMKKPGG
jgi:3-hydroxyacyl-[acyl-carrier-protein] dehydratase